MTVLAWPKAGHYNRALQNPSTGALLVSTSYDVYLSDGTTHATIYTDSSRTSTRTQPLTTDISGNAGFYTDPYSGLIISSGGGIQVTDVLPDVSDLMGPPFFSDGGSNSSYTLSGADNLKKLGFMAGSAGTTTMNIGVPNNLLKDFQCSIYNEGLAAIRFLAASGTTLEAGGISSSTNIGHPGPKYWCDLYCRFNGSGTAAVVTISPGIA